MFGLFVICRFDSVFKRYSQLCLKLLDGLIHAVSVVSLPRVRFETKSSNRINSVQESLAAATQKDEMRGSGAAKNGDTRGGIS